MQSTVSREADEMAALTCPEKVYFDRKSTVRDRPV